MHCATTVDALPSSPATLLERKWKALNVCKKYEHIPVETPLTYMKGVTILENAPPVQLRGAAVARGGEHLGGRGCSFEGLGISNGISNGEPHVLLHRQNVIVLLIQSEDRKRNEPHMRRHTIGNAHHIDFAGMRVCL